MNLHDHERYGMIRLFETFIQALSTLVDQVSVLFSWRRNRVAVSHRLAQHLEQNLLSVFSGSDMPQLLVDMCAPIVDDMKTLTPDIVVHNRDARNPKRLMAIICRETYLTEEELVGLHDLKERGQCELTLAIAFLPERDYMLIYRSDEATIDYYHFFRNEKHCQLFRRRQFDELLSDHRQLKLGITSRKRSAHPR